MPYIHCIRLLISYYHPLLPPGPVPGGGRGDPNGGGPGADGLWYAHGPVPCGRPCR